MNQNKERKIYPTSQTTKEELLLSSIPFVEWVCSNFNYDRISIWKRHTYNKGTPYTKEQLIKQYLNENG